MKHRQFIRESTANADARVGYPGELTVDIDLNDLRLHDGHTPGGHPIKNEANRDALAQSEWTGEVLYSVPGAISAADMGKLAEFSIAGDYTLPALAGLNDGHRLTIHSLVDGINILSHDPDVIQDKANAALTTINLLRWETVLIAKKSAESWLVISRY